MPVKPMAARQPRQKKTSAVQLPLEQRAVKLVAQRMRSAEELRKKLVSEGYEADAIEKTISRLKEVYLLDDRKMAAAVGRYYKDRGDRFIKAKLLHKGISAEEHAQAIDELPDELERALAAAAKKLRLLGSVEPQLAARKLWQHLAGRGFSGATVQKVVRQLVRGHDAEFPN